MLTIIVSRSPRRGSADAAVPPPRAKFVYYKWNGLLLLSLWITRGVHDGRCRRGFLAVRVRGSYTRVFVHKTTSVFPSCYYCYYYNYYFLFVWFKWTGFFQTVTSSQMNRVFDGDETARSKNFRLNSGVRPTRGRDAAVDTASDFTATLILRVRHGFRRRTYFSKYDRARFAWFHVKNNRF